MVHYRLDGETWDATCGAGEISLGGSRLSRFMKDIENVTGRMGEGEAMAPAEEAASVAAASAEAPAEVTSPDPWTALLQIGTQLVSALSAAGDPSAAPHPWMERDPATGARSLRVPLPPPETARCLADALSAIADSLRGKSAGA